MAAVGGWGPHAEEWSGEHIQILVAVAPRSGGRALIIHSLFTCAPSVVKQWVKHKLVLASTDTEDLTRFNEAIDQSVAESVVQYTKMITRSRNLFLGILGHDLRNPISAAAMAARSMARRGDPGEQQTVLAGHIVEATERGIEILDKLLDVTRSAFGEEFRVGRQRLDVARIGAKLVQEMTPIARGRTIALRVGGDRVRRRMS